MSYLGLSRPGSAERAGPVRYLEIPGYFGGASSIAAFSLTANRTQWTPFWMPFEQTWDQLSAEVTTLQASSVVRFALHSANDNWQPVAVIEDFGTINSTTTGVKTLTPSGGSRIVPPGRYLMATNSGHGVGLRGYRANWAPIDPAHNAFAVGFYVAQTLAGAAFPGTPLAWDNHNLGSANLMVHYVLVRVLNP